MARPDVVVLSRIIVTDPYTPTEEAVVLGARIRARDLSAVEAVAAALQRIEQIDGERLRPLHDALGPGLDAAARARGQVDTLLLGPGFLADRHFDVDGILLHEGVHVWQYAMEYIAEVSPSKEFEALGIQHIVHELKKAYKKAHR